MAEKISSKNVNVRLYNIVLLEVDKQIPDNYVDMFFKVFQRGIVVKTGDDKRTKMYSLSKTTDLLFGTLYNYTKIKDGDW